MFKPTGEETVLVAQILSHVVSEYGREPYINKPDNSMGTYRAIQMFSAAGLRPEVLITIIGIADNGDLGYLTRRELAIAVRLIGWAQNGAMVTERLVSRCGPLAVIKGLPVMHPDAVYRHSRHAPKEEVGEQQPPTYPPLTSQIHAKFRKLFFKNSAERELLNGQKVWKLFAVSKLRASTISRIWDLVDLHGAGDLDLTGFIVAMYFVDGLMRKLFSSLPPTVPTFIWEQAKNPLLVSPSRPSPGGSRHATRLSRGGLHISSALRANAAMHFTVLDKERTGCISQDVFFSHLSEWDVPEVDAEAIWAQLDADSMGFITQEKFTLGLYLMHRKLTSQWPIPSSVRCSASRIFDLLDLEGRGYIKEDVMVPFVMQFKLPSEDLTRIRKLAHLQGWVHQTKDDLMLVLYLIHRRLGGRSLPHRLPADLLGISAEPDQADEDDAVAELGGQQSAQSSASSQALSRSPAAFPINADLRSEVSELRTMIEGLRRQNQSLMAAMQQGSRSSGNHQEREHAVLTTSLSDSEYEQIPEETPPPYEEIPDGVTLSERVA